MFGVMILIGGAIGLVGGIILTIVDAMEDARIKKMNAEWDAKWWREHPPTDSPT